jgi:hypothetical protein
LRRSAPDDARARSLRRASWVLPHFTSSLFCRPSPSCGGAATVLRGHGVLRPVSPALCRGVSDPPWTGWIGSPRSGLLRWAWAPLVQFRGHGVGGPETPALHSNRCQNRPPRRTPRSRWTWGRSLGIQKPEIRSQMTQASAQSRFAAEAPFCLPASVLWHLISPLGMGSFAHFLERAIRCPNLATFLNAR